MTWLTAARAEVLDALRTVDGLTVSVGIPTPLGLPFAAVGESDQFITDASDRLTYGHVEVALDVTLAVRNAGQLDASVPELDALVAEAYDAISDTGWSCHLADYRSATLANGAALLTARMTATTTVERTTS